MDLGLRGKSGIVCASSRGLGRACARSLAREGVAVVVNGRDAAALEKTAGELRAETGSEVTPVVADLDVQSERERLVAACPDADILVNNNAGPPPGRFQDWGHAEWLAALESNLLAPVLLIRALLPGMRERRFGRIVNITSAMVKAPPWAATRVVSAGRTSPSPVKTSINRWASPPRPGSAFGNVPRRTRSPMQATLAPVKCTTRSAAVWPPGIGRSRMTSLLK